MGLSPTLDEFFSLVLPLLCACARACAHENTAGDNAVPMPMKLYCILADYYKQSQSCIYMQLQQVLQASRHVFAFAQKY